MWSAPINSLLVAKGQHPSAAYGGNTLFSILVFLILVLFSGAHL
jgi:hypothetical protein